MSAAARKTVLIIEDEPLIAIDLEAVVSDMGHRPLTVSNLDLAVELVNAGTIDFALLNYAVRSKDTTPVALALRAGRVPFAVCSGSQPRDVTEAFRDVPFVGKPYATSVVQEAIRSGLDGR